MTLQPLFKDHREAVPNCIELYDKMMTLPLHADLTHEEQDFVIEALNDFS